MSIVNNIESQLKGSTRPIVKVLMKNNLTRCIAIGLAENVELSDHKSPAPAQLLILKGSINYQSQSADVILNALDEFEIPQEEVHRVIAKEDSIFLLIINHERPGA